MKALTNILMGLLLITLMICMFLPFTNDAFFAMLGPTGTTIWCVAIFVSIPIISSYNPKHHEGSKEFNLGNQTKV